MATKKSTTSAAPKVVSGGYSGIPSTTAAKSAPKGGGTAASGSKLVQPIKQSSVKTGGNKSSLDKQIESGMAGIKDSLKELAKIGATLSGTNTSAGGAAIINPGNRSDASYVEEGRSGTSNTGKKYIEGRLVSDEEFNKWLYGDSESGGGDSDSSITDYQKMMDEKARTDAFALLRDVFNSYGLAELASEIEGYMKQGIGTNQATIQLKQSKAYKDRFYGNELRLASGRNVINEAEYLDLENSYSETLKAYGLQDYFGVGATPDQRKNRQKAIANVIGADISAVEFKDRVSTAVDRVKMADKATKDAFQQFYGIGEADLAKYFLDPARTLVNLKEKALSAEIGGAAIGVGLPATMASAEDLAKFGISREQAQVGYSTIAQELPTATKLGQIYSQEGITYGQTEAEQATFKGLESAKRKRQQLVSREEAAFQGSSGTALSSGALSTQYLRRTSSGGQF